MLSLVNINICVNVTAFVMYTQTEKNLATRSNSCQHFCFHESFFFVLTWSVMDIFFFFMGENCKCRGMMVEESGMNTRFESKKFL